LITPGKRFRRKGTRKARRGGGGAFTNGPFFQSNAGSFVLKHNTGVVPGYLRCSTTLKTNEAWAPVGANAWYLRCNDLFDPLASMGSEKPRDYTILNTLYDFYFVPQGRVKVTFYNTSDIDVNVGYYFSTASTSPASFRGAFEKGHGFRVTAIETPGFDTAKMSTGWLKWILQDYYPQRMTYDNAYAALTASPEWPIYLQVYGTPASGNFTMECLIEMQFDLVAFSRKTISPESVELKSNLLPPIGQGGRFDGTPSAFGTDTDEAWVDSDVQEMKTATPTLQPPSDKKEKTPYTTISMIRKAHGLAA